MVFFTTPELLEIGGLPLVSPYEKPTRLEALRYYRRVVDTYQIQIAFEEQVVEIDRDGDGTFVVTTATPDGASRVREARAVVLGIGYYDFPNYLSVPGEDLPHVSHYYDDAHPYTEACSSGGWQEFGGRSALELFRGGAHVTMVHRRATLGDSIKYWVRPDIENRIKEGSIGARFDTCVVEITPRTVIVEGHGGRDAIPADHVFLLTGYHPDVDLMTRAGIRCDPESYKPELNTETYETNVPNLFIAGGAIAGKHTGSIFIENGRFHGEKIIKVLADRLRGTE